MIVEKDFSGVPFFYDSDDKDHWYRRIIGGVEWPGKRPGFAVVVGEDFEEDKSLDVHHLWVLKEHETESTKKLIEKCMEFKYNNGANKWYGDISNEIEMAFVEKANKNINYRDHLYIEEAPFSDEPEAFAFCVRIIKKCVDTQGKYLHFNKSEIPAYLREIQSEAKDSLKVGDYPAISALGYAIGYLSTYEPPSLESRAVDDSKAYDYNPLRWGTSGDEYER